MNTDELTTKSAEELEEIVLEGLEQEPLPLDNLLAALERMAELKGGEVADGLAELLQEALPETERDAMLRLLALRAAWRGNDSSFSEVCRRALKPFFADRLGKSLLKNAGFDKRDVKPLEALRRLGVLVGLKEGQFCYDKTWGFGVVKRVDDFYEKVSIDFDSKPRHEMSFAYAGESLRLIDDDHLLARLHSDGDALRRLVADDPAEVVKITLRSYGPLSATELKDYLVDSVMDESGWKPFWEAARRALKNDAGVHLPAKRSEPIQLLDSAEDHINSLFAALAELRDPESIITRIEELEADGILKQLDDESKSILADRLAFAIWGAEGKHPDLVAKALLYAEKYGLISPEGTIGERAAAVSETLESLLQADTLRQTLSLLPVRLVGGLLAMASQDYAELLTERLLAILTELPFAVVNEAIARMVANGYDRQVGDAVTRLLDERAGSPALILWGLRNIEKVQSWGHSDRTELLRQGFDAIEWPAAGEQLRAQHQIRALFESGSWFKDQMADLSHEQRVVMLNLVRTTRGWEEADKRAVLAGILKAFPELKAGTEKKVEDATPRGRFTSWRTYRERQQQLKHLLEVEIPENSREIAVARSYGDLRENAEYQYAKEHQVILYRRRDELNAAFKQVKGHDFSGIDTSVAGMGTSVTIERPDGSRERYTILGEWDRDEELNIISNLSRLAKLIEGHKAGETVDLPSGDRMEPCRIVAVEDLDDAVREWLQGGDLDK